MVCGIERLAGEWLGSMCCALRLKVVSSQRLWTRASSWGMARFDLLSTFLQAEVLRECTT